MKNGFKVMDSDLHTMEPDGLWERYLDEPFKKFAPRFVRRDGVWEAMGYHGIMWASMQQLRQPRARSPAGRQLLINGART